MFDLTQAGEACIASLPSPLLVLSGGVLGCDLFFFFCGGEQWEGKGETATGKLYLS